MGQKVYRTVSVSVGVGLAALAVCVAGCGGQARGRPGDPAAAAARVETVRVARTDWTRVSEATPAELLPYEKTDRHAKVSGYLQEIRVDYGDRVKKGEVLAVLWVPELDKELEQKKALVARSESAIRQARQALQEAEAGVRSAEARVTEAEAGRPRARASHDYWQAQYQRLERVAQNKALDKQTLEEARYQFEAARAELTEVEAEVSSARALLEQSKARRDKAQADVVVAEANLRVAGAEREQVEAVLGYTRILAPYDGVVARRYLHTGAFIAPRAGDPPVLTVLRTDRLRVVVDVPEKDVRYLNKGTKVTVALDAYPGKKLTWQITRLAPVLGPGKRVRVEVEIPNPDGALYAGMYGHAAVILEEKPGALTLPAACVRSDDRGTFVWVVVHGTAKRQAVTVGLRDDEKAENHLRVDRHGGGDLRRHGRTRPGAARCRPGARRAGRIIDPGPRARQVSVNAEPDRLYRALGQPARDVLAEREVPCAPATAPPADVPAGPAARLLPTVSHP